MSLEEKMRSAIKQLIIVFIAIIGIPAYAMHEVDYNNIRTHISEAILDCNQLKSQINEFAMKNGKLPVSMNTLKPPSPQSKYVKSMDLLDNTMIRTETQHPARSL